MKDNENWRDNVNSNDKKKSNVRKSWNVKKRLRGRKSWRNKKSWKGNRRRRRDVNEKSVSVVSARKNVNGSVKGNENESVRDNVNAKNVNVRENVSVNGSARGNANEKGNNESVIGNEKKSEKNAIVIDEQQPVVALLEMIAIVIVIVIGTVIEIEIAIMHLNGRTIDEGKISYHNIIKFCKSITKP